MANKTWMVNLDTGELHFFPAYSFLDSLMDHGLLVAIKAWLIACMFHVFILFFARTDAYNE